MNVWLFALKERKYLILSFQAVSSQMIILRHVLNCLVDCLVDCLVIVL